MVQRITEFINTSYSTLGVWPFYVTVFYNYTILTIIIIMGLLKKKLPRKIWRFREAGSILVFLLVASLAFAVPDGNQIISMRNNIWRVYDSTQVTPVEPKSNGSDEILGVGESTDITDGAFTFHVENTGDVPLRDIQIAKNTDTPPTPPVDVDSPIEYELDQPVKGEDVEQAIMNIFETLKSILTVLIAIYILYSLLFAVTNDDLADLAFQSVKRGIVMLVLLSLLTPMAYTIRSAANQTENLAETHTFIPVHVVVTNNGNEPLTDLELTLDGTVLEPTWIDTDTLETLPAGKSSEAVVYLEAYLHAQKHIHRQSGHMHT